MTFTLKLLGKTLLAQLEACFKSNFCTFCTLFYRTKKTLLCTLRSPQPPWHGFDISNWSRSVSYKNVANHNRDKLNKIIKINKKAQLDSCDYLNAGLWSAWAANQLMRQRFILGRENLSSHQSQLVIAITISVPYVKYTQNGWPLVVWFLKFLGVHGWHA